MPLVTCRDCGSQVSDQALACPKCGRPMTQARPGPPKTTLTKPAGCFLQLVALFLMLSGLGLCIEGGSGGWFFGVLLIVGGVWLFIVGRRPALK